MRIIILLLLFTLLRTSHSQYCRRQCMRTFCPQNLRAKYVPRCKRLFSRVCRAFCQRRWGSLGERCNRWRQCKRRYVCGRGFRCRRKYILKLGEMCSVTRECEKGLKCRRKICSRILEKGARCGTKGLACRKGLVCTKLVNGEYLRWPYNTTDVTCELPVEVGKYCYPHTKLPSPCKGVLKCVSVNLSPGPPYCAYNIRPGQKCRGYYVSNCYDFKRNSNGECVGPPNNQICRSLASTNGPCTNNPDCLAGNRCIKGRCALIVPEGGSCTNLFDKGHQPVCDKGLTCRFDNGKNTCVRSTA